MKLILRCQRLTRRAGLSGAQPGRNRMVATCRLPALVLAFLLLTCSLLAQSLDGGTTARAGVHDLALKSSQALAFNAALLGSPRENLYCIEFLNSGLSLVNSAFSTSYWNSHLAGDRFLDEKAKREILDQIGPDGISFDGRVTVPVAGLAYKNFALRVALDSYASGLVPRDAVEVLLQGNQLGQEYSVNALRGESASLLDVSMGIGHAFEQEWIKNLSVGTAVHYYQGLSLAKLTQTAGTFQVTDSLVRGSAFLRSVEATSGDGIGFDLGALAEINDRWQAGLSVRQIGVHMSWTVETNRILSGEIDSGGVYVDSLDQDGYLDRVFQSQDTTYPGGTIDIRLPTVLLLNARFAPSSRVNLLGELNYISRGSPSDEAEIALGVATQWRARRWLELQTGVTLGSLWKSQVGLGGGLRFKNYELDLGWSWNGGLFNHARGIALGMTHRLKF